MSLDTPEGPATDRADERMGKVLRAGLALTSGAATREAAMDQDQIYAELDRVRDDFRGLLDSATVGELRQPTNGTKWNNEQLLFHMLFGYLLVRNLRLIVWGFSRLPDSASRRFAFVLNAGTRPFHVVNYVGSLFGARVLGYARIQGLMDRVVTGLQRSLRAQSDESLARGMHFPVGWDPYFRDFMTLLEVYHYPTQHYDHHRRQLTLASARQG
ncbi:MAG TPA: DinB family protein [Candidatus Nanopelagicales bacterium]|nr:DinB family protein [Candidatus Nanopelagicales bacterium]